MSTSPNLRAAEGYVKHGFALLPLQPHSKDPHFSVLTSTYGHCKTTHLLERPAPLRDIRRWFSLDPTANVGIVTGNISQLVVVDFDNPTLGCDHPPTPEVETHRGKQLYFHGDHVDFTCLHHDLDGEIRANSSYVVAPPSYHKSGHQYYWRVSLNDLPLADWHSFKDHPLVTAALATHAKAHRQRTGSTPRSSKTYPPPYCDPPRLGQLAAVVEIVAQHLGIRTVLHESTSRSFHCILPGHLERRPSATLVRHPESGVWLYKDHHRDGLCYTLADVRASIAAGRPLKLKSPPTALYWYGRLFAECGIIDPIRISIRTRPGCPESEQKVADGLSLLMGIREMLNPGDPTPFTASFNEIWSGVSKKQHQLAMKHLEEFGSIRRVGTYREGEITQCILWEAL